MEEGDKERERERERESTKADKLDQLDLLELLVCNVFVDDLFVWLQL